MALNVASLEGEAQDFPRSTWHKGIFYGVRRLICGSDDVVSLLTQIDTPPNNQWPYPGGSSDAIAVKAEWRNVPGAAHDSSSTQELAHYEKSQVTIWYSSDSPRFIGGYWIEERMEPTQKNQRVDYTQMQWATGNTPLNAAEAFGRLTYAFDYIITYHKLNAVPAWILSRVEHVNSNTVNAPILGLSFAPETLLFKPPTMMVEYSLATIPQFMVILRYGYHPAGWNKQWRISTTKYENVQTTAGQYNNYQSTGF